MYEAQNNVKNSYDFPRKANSISGHNYKSNIGKNDTYESVCCPEDVQERARMAQKANNSSNHKNNKMNGSDRDMRGTKRNGQQKGNNNLQMDGSERSKCYKKIIT